MGYGFISTVFLLGTAKTQPRWKWYFSGREADLRGIYIADASRILHCDAHRQQHFISLQAGAIETGDLLYLFDLRALGQERLARKVGSKADIGAAVPVASDCSR